MTIEYVSVSCKRRVIDWSSVKDLGLVPDTVIARRLDCDDTTVQKARRARKIPAYAPRVGQRASQGTPTVPAHVRLARAILAETPSLGRPGDTIPADQLALIVLMEGSGTMKGSGSMTVTEIERALLGLRGKSFNVLGLVHRAIADGRVERASVGGRGRRALLRLTERALTERRTRRGT